MKKIAFAVAALLSLSVAADCLAARSPYPARLYPGPYFSGFVGVSAPLNTDISPGEVGGTFSDRAEFDPNINVGGTFGYDFVPLRLEAELSYKHGEFTTVTDRLNDLRFVDVDGRVGALALMVNAFVDLHNASPITPYVGGGAGFASLHISDTWGTDVDTGTVFGLYESDDDAVFAYQAGGGIGIELNRQMTLDLGYRYFATSRAHFVDSSFKFESHNAAVGLRVRF